MRTPTPRYGISGDSDSLVDTLTNVVGVLIVILAVSHVAVREAAERLRKEEVAVIPDTAAELALMHADAERTKLRMLFAEQKWRELKMAIAALPQSSTPVIATPSWDASVLPNAELRSRSYQEEISILRQELASRTAELEGLRRRGGRERPPPEPRITIVTVPDPRPAPQDGQRVTILFRHGRAVLFDGEALMTSLKDGIVAAGASLEMRVSAAQAAELLATHFTNHQVGIDGFRWRIDVRRHSDPATEEVRREVAAVLEWPNTPQGEPLTQLQREDSAFRRAISNAAPQNAYFICYVWSDSFGEYAVARELMEQRQVPAGWAAMEGHADHRVVLSDTRLSGPRVEASRRIEPQPARSGTWAGAGTGTVIPIGGSFGGDGIGGGVSVGTSGDMVD